MALRRLLVANRGEIALRIVRAAQAPGHRDGARRLGGRPRQPRRARGGPHRRARAGAGQAVYLDARLVVHAAKATGCDALHPGYGFLSETRGTRARCARTTASRFVGPRRDIDRGARRQARARASWRRPPACRWFPAAARIATVGRRAGASPTKSAIRCVMKASAGGGGRGMVMARNAGRARRPASSARRREAQEAFGDGTLFLERFVADGPPRRGAGARRRRRRRAAFRRARLLGAAPLPEDGRGGAARRSCPDARAQPARGGGAAPVLDRATATPARSSSSTTSSATTFYFIEVNARIQVEHPVSEAISGVDLIAAAVARRRRRAARARRRTTIEPRPATRSRCRINRRGPRPRLRAVARPHRRAGSRPRARASASTPRCTRARSCRRSTTA